MFDGLLARNCHLENSNHTASHGIFIIIFRIDLLKGFKGFDRIIEVAHLVAVICNDEKEIKRVWRGLSWEVDVPGVLRFAIHYVSPDQPFDIALIGLVTLIPDGQEALFSLFIVPGRCAGYGVIPMEVIVRFKVALNAVKVD